MSIVSKIVKKNPLTKKECVFENWYEIVDPQVLGHFCNVLIINPSWTLELYRKLIKNVVQTPFHWIRNFGGVAWVLVGFEVP